MLPKVPLNALRAATQRDAEGILAVRGIKWERAFEEWAGTYLFAVVFFSQKQGRTEVAHWMPGLRALTIGERIWCDEFMARLKEQTPTASATAHLVNEPDNQEPSCTCSTLLHGHHPACPWLKARLG